MSKNILAANAGNPSFPAGAPALAGAINPGENLSQSQHITRKKASSKIRANYRHEPRWSYAEASNFCGAPINTVRAWASKGKFKPGYRAGAYRVDASSFIKFLETGKAQK